MRGRSLALGALLVVLADGAGAQLFEGGELGGGELGAPPARSVLIVISDDDGIAGDGNYGAAGDWIPSSTPALDKVSTQGVRVATYYANAVCAPTRASLMQIAFNSSDDGGTGVFDAVGALEWDYERESHLGLLLRVLGVQTAAFGKMQSVCTLWAGKWGAVHCGWDTFVGQIGAGTIDHWNWARTEAYRWQYDLVAPELATDPPITDVPTSGHFDTYHVTRALEHYAARDRSRPFLGWIALYEPHLSQSGERHHPLVDGSGEAYCATLGPYECQAAMRASVDTSLARVLAAADRNTCVIFTGDNGEVAGAQGVPNGGKGSLVEGGIRSRLYFFGCGIAPGTITELVHASDVAATIADLLGLPAYAGADAIDGYSLAEPLGLPSGLAGRAWSDKPADRGVVIARAPGGTVQRAYLSDAWPGFKLLVDFTTGATALHDVSGFVGGAAEPADLCGGDGDCGGLVGAPALAYAGLCTGLAADDDPGGAGCTP